VIAVHPLTPPKLGDVLSGRYVLEAEIGRGGFGVVYRATQRGLGEPVAVKVLHPELVSDPALAARFEREVQVVKGLRHPNTIRVIDTAETDSGLPYFVMEFISGQRLDQLIDQTGPMTASRTRRIAIQILKSLTEAHSAGVIHRDLKPQNIFLAEIVGEFDYVKVLDFGLAKAVGSALGRSSGLTGQIALGTPHYMSPEQAMAEETVDGRADLYSVALLIAEMLHGAPVVAGDSPVQILSRQVDPDPHVFPPSVLDSPLAAVVVRGAQKDRRERFTDTSAMILALESLGSLDEGRPSSSELLAMDARSAFGVSLSTVGENWEREPTGRRVAPDHSAALAVTNETPAAFAPTVESRPYRRRSIVALVAALGLVVLIAALALGLDWGSTPAPSDGHEEVIQLRRPEERPGWAPLRSTSERLALAVGQTSARERVRAAVTVAGAVVALTPGPAVATDPLAPEAVDSP
jgi:serine/threonine protein kinase